MFSCNEIDFYASMYIDNMLSELEVKQFEQHLLSCEKCKARYNELKNIVETCDEIDEIPLPQNFEQMLHNKLLAIQPQKKNGILAFMLQYKRTLATVGTAAVILVTLLAYNLIPHYSASRNDSSAAQNVEAAADSTAAVGQYSGSAIEDPEADSKETGEAINDIAASEPSTNAISSTAELDGIKIKVNANANEAAKSSANVKNPKNKSEATDSMSEEKTLGAFGTSLPTDDPSNSALTIMGSEEIKIPLFEYNVASTEGFPEKVVIDSAIIKMGGLQQLTTASIQVLEYRLSIDAYTNDFKEKIEADSGVEITLNTTNSAIDLSEQYRDLTQQKSDIESQIAAKPNETELDSLNIKLEAVKAKIKEIEDMKLNVIIRFSFILK